MNENTKGLIRQFFPKGNSLSEVTDAEIQTVMDKLNNRPRKFLGFKTPNQVFLVLIHRLHLRVESAERFMSRIA